MGARPQVHVDACVCAPPLLMHVSLRVMFVCGGEECHWVL